MTGPVSEVTISDPKTRNALGLRTLRDLTAAVSDLSTREGTRVVVLAGDCGTFSSGANLKEDSPVEEVAQAIACLYESIAEAPTPVIARVEGNCLGLAVGIVAACDLAIAAQDCHFALPEPRLGQAPTMAAYSVVPKLRPADASRLLLTGAAFDGDVARDIGLVNASVPATQLDEEVRTWAGQIIDGGPQAVATCKRLARSLSPVQAEDALRLATQLTIDLADSSEAREGKRAFLQRRPPAWVAADHTRSPK